jgi:hypothetical protein
MPNAQCQMTNDRAGRSNACAPRPTPPQQRSCDCRSAAHPGTAHGPTKRSRISHFSLGIGHCDQCPMRNDQCPMRDAAALARVVPCVLPGGDGRTAGVPKSTGKFGQQTPRRWGWGTPLKKRTATRTKSINMVSPPPPLSTDERQRQAAGAAGLSALGQRLRGAGGGGRSGGLAAERNRRVGVCHRC